MVTTKTFGELHKEYNTLYPNNTVAYGTFVALKPFYIRAADEKEIAMCLCKIHLHMRRAIEGLVKLCAKQDINLPFDCYKSFFEHLQTNCMDSNSDTYLPWICTPDKKTVCDHQQIMWSKLKEELELKARKDVKRRFEHFVMKDVEKNGETKLRLTVESLQVDVSFILHFIEKNLSTIIHHRNLLSNFRSVYPKVLEALSTIEVSLDFSENLTLTLPEEIQSMYWGQAKTEISIHSGIFKSEGNKVYHPYLSNDLFHDQAFVYVTLNKMLSNTDVEPGSTIIVTSDNCCSQYTFLTCK